MTTMLEPGPYVLTEDVENPKPDGRQKYDWRLHRVWKKGDRFDVVEEWASLDPDDDHKIPALQRVQRHSCLYRASLKSDIWALLAPKLQRVEETLDDVLRLSGSSFAADDALQYMVDTGKLSLQDVRDALDGYKESEKDSE